MVIGSVGLIRSDLLAGRIVALLAGLVSVYWWSCYRRLDH